MDKQRWERISPLLDELLDASPQGRAERLAALRREDRSVAAALGQLLDGLSAVDAGFLCDPVVGTEGVEGQAVGAYRLERRIGRGGMGVVWLARRADGRFDGQVAVKFVDLALMSSGGVERFEQEGRILARLSHPNIARLVDAGVGDNRQPYLLLEYVDGLPIDRHCEQHDLDVRARLALFADVLAAVAHAHARLILHRDIKPGNILVDKQGTVKLLDFGIAKLLDADRDEPLDRAANQAIARTFTPAYAAPEQVRGQGVSMATDVYSLGVLLYGLLGGGHPTGFTATGASPNDPLRTVIEIEPRRLSDAVAAQAAGGTRGDRKVAARRARAVRGDLDHIVARALSKSPMKRYAGAAEFAQDLQRHLSHRPVEARPETARYVATKFVRRHRLAVVMTSLVALALAFAAVSSVLQAHKLLRQRQRAEMLVEFMLGDLRKKLQPVGRLDVLDGVGAEVLHYYDTPEQAALADADSLARRARALHLIGAIRDKRGRLDDARTALSEAARTTQALLDDSPRDGQRLFDHAQSMFWLGNIERRLGHDEPAAAAMGEYLALTRRLVALDPTRDDWRIELADANEAVAVLQLQANRVDEALRSLDEARLLQQSLEAAHPDQRIELARTFGWLAEAWLARDNLPAALQAQRDKLAVLARVPHEGDDQIVREQRAIALSSVSALLRMLGDPASARVTRAQALQGYESLVALDPSNMIWLANLCAVRIGMAETLVDLGDQVGAAELLKQTGRDIERAQAASTAESPRHLFIEGRALIVQARIAAGASLAPAIADLRGFHGRLADYFVEAHASDKDLRQLAIQSHQALGELLARAGQAEAARREWTEVADHLRGAAPSPTLLERIAFAQALHGLGRHDEARDLAQQLLLTVCRTPELRVLAAELGLDGTVPASASDNPASSHAEPPSRGLRGGMTNLERKT